MADELIKTLEVPSLGLSVEEVTVVDWLIGEGDSFESGDEICELETEKSVNAMEAPFAGTLRLIVARAGDVLPVQGVLALVAEATVSDEQIADYLARNAGADPASSTLAEVIVALEQTPTATKQTDSAVASSLDQSGDDSDVHATPRARQLAAASGVNLNGVPGSGRNQRISRRDVERAIASAGQMAGDLPVTRVRAVVAVSKPELTAVSPTSSVVGKPLDSMRRTIAGRLQKSKQTIPHYRLVVDVGMDRLLSDRQKMNRLNREKISVNDFFVKACADALMEVPDVNIQFDGENVYRHSDADVAVAVALDGGLITPIVRAAQTKSLADIAREVKDLVARARAKSLRPDEYQGGTFCISNLGMYGVRQFDAIINQPHGAILAVGAVRDCVVAVDGQPEVSRMTTLTLSCDHRVIDGALGARFLAALKQALETSTEDST